MPRVRRAAATRVYDTNSGIARAYKYGMRAVSIVRGGQYETAPGSGLSCGAAGTVWEVPMDCPPSFSESSALWCCGLVADGDAYDVQSGLGTGLRLGQFRHNAYDVLAGIE